MNSETFLEIIKAGLTCPELLSPFEADFLREIAREYSKYGRKFKLTEKRVVVLREIRDKILPMESWDIQIDSQKIK